MITDEIHLLYRFKNHHYPRELSAMLVGLRNKQSS